jgi:hypothetical protein
MQAGREAHIPRGVIHFSSQSNLEYVRGYYAVAREHAHLRAWLGPAIFLVDLRVIMRAQGGRHA